MAQHFVLSQLGLNIHVTNCVATPDSSEHRGARPGSSAVSARRRRPGLVCVCGGGGRDFSGILSIFIEGEGEVKKGFILLLIYLTHWDLPITPGARIVPSS